LVTVQEMRQLERATMRSGTSEASLMEQAGTAVAEAVARWLPRTDGRSMLVLAGKGNNGGDALIAARVLRQRFGMQPRIYLTSPRDGDPLLSWTASTAIPVAHHAENGTPTVREWLHETDVVLDGLLGVGARLPITGAVAEVLQLCHQVRQSGQRRIAVDVPTGVHADTGDADAHAFAADLTLATGPAKPGLYLFPGARFAGRVQALDIGLDLDSMPLNVRRRIDWEVAPLLPPRPDDSHKGTYGKVLVIAGSDRYIGAAYMTGAATVGTGAGLVTLAVPAHVQSAIAGARPELTFLPLPDDPQAPGRISTSHLETLLEAILKYDAVAIGPGLGTDAKTQHLVQQLADRLAKSSQAPPIVFDADALNALAAAGEWERPAQVRWVLTPHPGELGRLTQTDAKTVLADRLACAQAQADAWGQVVVAKGAPSIVASPNGRADLGVFANAALATAGTGDVLTGAIAALLAQGLDVHDAAVAGVYLHGLAGELWRAKHGRSGLPASHLVEYLPLAQRRLRESR
ncbi:MAG TPA: NAD(P)H-hydrate dehydratase, partial [Chloroflexota bacterium]|nr:NAD(P)H-hydrate dehydratase [Chloroflexota bacterium]